MKIRDIAKWVSWQLKIPLSQNAQKKCLELTIL
jgi:hypothetical protein